jgi:hypothetical protein
VKNDLDNNFVDIVCPTVLPTLPYDTICSGQNVTLLISDLNLGSLTYSWNFGSGSTPGTGSGLGPHTISYVTTTQNQLNGASVVLTISKAGCPNLVGEVTKIDVNAYPNAAINTSTAPICYYTNKTFQPVAAAIPGATYTWTFGAGAVPATATGYGPHTVYYTTTGTKTAKLVIHPNEAGAQCPDSSTVSFTILLCPGTIIGFVKSVAGVGIPGVTVKLFADANADGMADNSTEIRNVLSGFPPGPLGRYVMVSLTPGSYVIVETQPFGWLSFDDLDASNDGDIVPNISGLDNIIPVTILPSEIDSMNNFIETPAPGNITGTVFEDFNNNQVPDSGEGLGSVVLNLYADMGHDGIADNGIIIATTTTLADGSFVMMGIAVGDYVLVETDPLNYISIQDGDPTFDGDLGPNFDPNDNVIPVSINNGETDANNFFIDDRLAPLIVCPADLTLECIAITDPSSTGFATATDYCDGNVTITYADVTVEGDCPQAYTILRTWSASDNCGNTSTCLQTIEIEDSTAPSITCPTDVTILCTANTLPLNTGFATATDICDPTTDLTYSDLINTGPCPQTYLISRTWQAFDDCGNVNTCLQLIQVIDNTPPTFTRPADITIFSDATCNYDASVAVTGDVTNEADNCGTGLQATFNDVTSDGPCEGSHVITRTWSLDDNCGNAAATQVQTITVSDNTAPTFTRPANITIFTDATCNYNASVAFTGDLTNEADNCSTGLQATFADVTVDGPCEGSHVITRTWSLVDNCGNAAANQVQTITVSDNTPPTFTRPANITIFTDAACNYNASVAVTGDVTNEADNCSIGLQATFNDVTVDGPCEGSHVITRTWSLVDNCGNAAANQVQTITVSDNTAPTFTSPANITIFTDATCNYDASVVATGDVTNEADNCSTGLQATFTDVTLDGSCEGSHVITRTWSLVDNCGNAAANQVQTITVSDNTAPTFTRPANITIFTDATCNYDASVAVTGDVINEADNCSTGLQATFTDVTVNGPCVGSHVITRTWSLVDNCGNAAAYQVQTITVSDNTAPTFTRPANITIFTDVACNYDASVAVTGDVTNEADNCSTGLQATFTDVTVDGPCEGSHAITRTWSLVDNCGNAAADQVQTITVSDNTPPTFTRPANITIFTDATCSYDASVAVTGDVTNEADNCSTGIQATFTDLIVDGPCEGSHVITRTWSLVDDCGNASANQVQTITVSDNTAPTFTRPANITIFTDAACNYNASVAVTGDVTNEADNCSIGLQATFNDVTVDGPCEGSHVITRTWSLVDNCGNAAANQVQTITVSDNTAPTFTSPANITIFTDATCNYDASVVATGDVTIEADNCSTGIQATFNDVTVDGPCEGSHVITRTWSLVDNCGNAAADQVQIITVTDNTAPTFTRPANITIFTDAICNNDASAVATGDVTNEADNCSTGLQATFTDVTVDGPCEGSHVITRTWSLVDNCGNAAANQVQTITVSDNTAPTFTRPANITIFTDATCNYDASVAVTGDVTNEADNCSTGLQATFTDVTVNGPCVGSHVITRTWSLVDNCGNAAPNQVQTITVSDNTAPTFTRPANITIFTDAACSYDASVAVTGDVTNEADNCSTGLQATFTDVTIEGPCEGSHVITRTWSLVDDCGNAAANQVQTITVSDNTVPTFTRPANITIFTDATCSYDASVAVTGDVTNEADNCSTGLQATFTDVTVDGPCEGSHVITRTWSLVDNCGNAAPNQVQTITVSDNTAPTFTRPANITIFTDAACSYDASVAVTGDVTNEADNCSTGLQATFTDVTVDGPCEGSHVITRTWSLVDNCGNAAANQIQAITVSDNTPPTFTRPANVTVFTDAACNNDASVAVTGDVTNQADNCSTGIQANFTDVTVDGPCEGSHVITRTWSLVDNCGNAAVDQVQTITVSDNTPPTFTRPANITIFTDATCSYDASVAVTGDVTNEADNCSTGLQATFNDVTVDGPCEGSHVITRTWSLWIIAEMQQLTRCKP